MGETGLGELRLSGDFLDPLMSFPLGLGELLELLPEVEFINENALTAFIGPCLAVEGDTFGRIRDIL